MGSKQEIQHYEQITYMLFIQLIDSTQLFSLSIPKRSLYISSDSCCYTTCFNIRTYVYYLSSFTAVNILSPGDTNIDFCTEMERQLKGTFSF